MALIAGIEAGGTKCICAIADRPDHILMEKRLPTRSPKETLNKALRFFEKAIKKYRDEHGPLMAMGIGSFGPVDLHPESKTYGYITSTPKLGWQNVDLCGPFTRSLGVSVGFDTDVNAAALGEAYAGAAQGLSTFMYITVGTGIGGGIIIDGKPVHGLLHPEAGHILLLDREGDDFPGICPYHGRCLEGLCSGEAMEKRWGVRAEKLELDHEAWDIEAYYLAQAIMTYVLTISPERVILGGGVMHQRQLFPKIRAYLKDFLNGYVSNPAILEESDSYIVPPGLEDRAGITGALVMANTLLEKRKDANTL